MILHVHNQILKGMYVLLSNVPKCSLVSSHHTHPTRAKGRFQRDVCDIRTQKSDFNSSYLLHKFLQVLNTGIISYSFIDPQLRITIDFQSCLHREGCQLKNV